MKTRKILIIGFGKIGLNHLNGLSRCQSKIDIFIYDKKIIKNINKNNKKITILNSLKKHQFFDLAIISTNSKERYQAFLELVKHNNVKNIIFEKFVY